MERDHPRDQESASVQRAAGLRGHLAVAQDPRLDDRGRPRNHTRGRRPVDGGVGPQHGSVAVVGLRTRLPAGR